MIEYSQEAKKAYLLAVHLKRDNVEVAINSLSEIDSLARSLDLEILGQTYQTRVAPDSKSYVGQGKLLEVKEFIDAKKVDLVLVDHDLSPNQAKFIENLLGCMVWDRTQLILEIFSGHAKTPESQSQVELAQMKYMLPRLVGLWTHLDRETGGIGASRGTGEKQINIDRSLIRKRIHRLETFLEKVEKERKVQAKNRSSCFQVGIVGYTNAGKTSLMNKLTEEKLLSEDKLFATLESTTRVLKGDRNPEILISDTVGFIRNLPHNLVASFRSTLSVVKDADVILHVLDASNSAIEEHIKTTEEVLKVIGAQNVPQLLVLNKMDQLEDGLDTMILKKTYQNASFISTFDDESVEQLQNKIEDFFKQNMVDREVHLPYKNADILSTIYDLGHVQELKYEEEGIYAEVSLTQVNDQRLKRILEKKLDAYEG